MNAIITINCRKGPGVRWSIIRDLSTYGTVGANEVISEDEETLWLQVAFRWSDPAFVGQAAGVLSHLPGILNTHEEAAPEVVIPPAPPVTKSKGSIRTIALGAAICSLAGFAVITVPKFVSNEPVVQQQEVAPPAPPAPAGVKTEAPKPQPVSEPEVAAQRPAMAPEPVQSQPVAKPEPRAAAAPAAVASMPPPPPARVEVAPARVAPRPFTPAPAPRAPETQVIAAPPVLQSQTEALSVTPAVKLPAIDQTFTAAAPKRPEPQAPAIAAISAPRPLKRVEPVVSGSMKNSLKGDIVVAVRVYVGPNGQVLSTVPMKQGDPKANQLAAIAADSVKQWQFEPATQNGKPLAGETIVRFRF